MVTITKLELYGKIIPDKNTKSELSFYEYLYLESRVSINARNKIYFKLEFWTGTVINFGSWSMYVSMYVQVLFPTEFMYSSNEIRKTQNEHLIIIFQNLIGL